MKEIRYAWLRAPENGLPEDCVRGTLQIIPGMGQWMLVHFSPPVAELPQGLIAADEAGRVLDELLASAV